MELKVYETRGRRKKLREGGMAILVERRARRCGPHRKALGRVNCTLSRDRRTSSSSSENGSEIVERFSRSEFVTVRVME